MFTSFDKAIAAFVLAVIFFLNNYTPIRIPLDEAAVNAIIAAAMPIVVWLVPNLKKTP